MGEKFIVLNVAVFVEGRGGGGGGERDCWFTTFAKDVKHARSTFGLISDIGQSTI